MTQAEQHVTIDRDDVIELRIAARPENIALARLALSGVASTAGAPPDVVADLKLAVSETCTNAIQHAYPNGTGELDEPVVIRFLVGHQALTVEVEDNGAGFDSIITRSWEERGNDIDSDKDGEDGRSLGMGLAIVRSVTDQVAIESGTHGTRVVFRKSFETE